MMPAARYLIVVRDTIDALIASYTPGEQLAGPLRFPCQHRTTAEQPGGQDADRDADDGAGGSLGPEDAIVEPHVDCSADDPGPRAFIQQRQQGRLPPRTP